MISISQPTGIIPKLDSTKLPENAASYAMDCDFSGGQIAGLPVPMETNDNFPSAESGYLYVNSDYSTRFYALPYDADFVRSPVQQDDHKRIYWTGKNGDNTEFKFMLGDENMSSVTPAVTYKVGVAQFVATNITMSNAIDTDGVGVAGFTTAEQNACIGGYSLVSAEPPVEWSSMKDVKNSVLLVNEDGETIKDITGDLVGAEYVGPLYRGWFTKLKFTMTKSIDDYTLADVSGIKYAQKSMRIGISGTTSTVGAARVWYGVTYSSDGSPVYTLRFIEMLNSIDIVSVEGSSITGSYVLLSDGDTGESLGSAKVMSATKLSVTGAAFPAGLSSSPSVTELDSKLSSSSRIAISITATMNGVTSTALFIQGETLKNAWSDGSGISGGIEAGETDYEWYMNLSFGEDIGTERRAYIFTFVNRIGEESAPWGLTELSLKSGAERVKFFVNLERWGDRVISAQSGRYPIHGIRVYRTSYGSTASDQYFYVGTVVNSGETITLPGDVYLDRAVVEGASVVFYDNVKSSALGASCTTIDFISDVSELQKLQGLTTLYNGILAAFKDNEVWYSEPYMPWAWKRSNIHTLAYRVVALLPQEQGVYILTENSPYYASGATPGTMVPSKIGVQYPCLNKHAAAAISGTSVYLSADGPVILNGGNASIDMMAFNREKWRKEITEYVATGGEVRLAAYGHRMIIYFTTPAADVCGYVYDMEDKSWTRMSTLMKIAITLPPRTSGWWTDNLAYSTGAGNWKIFGFDSNETVLWRWSSKDFVLTRPINFGIGQVYGSGRVLVKIKADGALKHTESIDLTDGGTVFRLPSGFIAAKWRIELEAELSGTMVRALNLAETALELANV